jgi:hypothetical protein
VEHVLQEMYSSALPDDLKVMMEVGDSSVVVFSSVSSGYATNGTLAAAWMCRQVWQWQIPENKGRGGREMWIWPQWQEALMRSTAEVIFFVRKINVWLHF